MAESRDPGLQPLKTPPYIPASSVVVPARRSFLGALLAVGAAGIGALLAVPLVRFAIHPLQATTTETKWSDIGNVNEFPVGKLPVKRLIKVEQLDGWRKIVSEKAVYVTTNAAGQLQVLSPICPHLGCSIAWSEAQRNFLCPCHVGIFAPNGSHISGPPPRAMDGLETNVENGILRVRYQYFRQLVPIKEVLA
jgi:menaquinol-cytochrome c reductase iron-sulfur subunit